VLTELPAGTVTFLFTDIEGSTGLLQELGDEYVAVLADHRRALRDAWRDHDGVEVDTQGDAFFVAFARATDAVAAAADAQRALEGGPVRVRMGLHTGEPLRADEGYVGLDVHRAARIAAAGHGGQVLLSQATVDIAGAEVRDLGLHRLKDLGAPERLFQLGDEDFPPLKTLHQTNLPVPATPFLGREREIDEIAALLRRPEIRLVTLTGPGGSGKTRLSLQAAAAAADEYERGVWWVPLASLADPALVEPAAAQALGSKDTLSAAVGDRRLLLVLDNFEHLLEAAGAVANTIGSCPRLTFLVTSREPLHVDGEWEVAVDPLREREAVDLFVQRALAVDSGFTANGEVVEICKRLDCLPLAIELAAARVKALSPSVLLERLEQRLPMLAGGSRSAPERQRTLRSTIAWSHDLLVTDEQELFARLAVFAGGCTLEAAEEICGADLDAIASLVDKSLLRRTGDRYWLLETIREFAAEQLEAAAAGVSELRDGHAAWFISLGERAASELYARRGPEWLDRLDAEQANQRAALGHLLARKDKDGALRLCSAIWLYWLIRGHWTEGRGLLNSALELDGNIEPELLVEALWGAAVLALFQEDVEEGERMATRLLDIARRAWLPRGEAIGVHALGMAALRSGNHEGAHELFEEARTLARDINDMWLLSAATHNLGLLYRGEGELERARELFEESLAIGEARGDIERRAHALSQLGQTMAMLGGFAQAHELFRRGLLAAAEIGLADEQINTVWGIASYQAELGDAVVAARLLGWTTEQLSRLGVPNDPSDPDNIRLEERLGERLGSERSAVEQAIGAAMTREDAIGLALGDNDSVTSA
jgi:predicted ATPase